MNEQLHFGIAMPQSLERVISKSPGEFLGDCNDSEVFLHFLDSADNIPTTASAIKYTALSANGCPALATAK